MTQAMQIPKQMATPRMRVLGRQAQSVYQRPAPEAKDDVRHGAAAEDEGQQALRLAAGENVPCEGEELDHDEGAHDLDPDVEERKEPMVPDLSSAVDRADEQAAQDHRHRKEAGETDDDQAVRWNRSENRA